MNAPSIFLPCIQVAFSAVLLAHRLDVVDFLGLRCPACAQKNCTEHNSNWLHFRLGLSIRFLMKNYSSYCFLNTSFKFFFMILEIICFRFFRWYTESFDLKYQSTAYIYMNAIKPSSVEFISHFNGPIGLLTGTYMDQWTCIIGVYMMHDVTCACMFKHVDIYSTTTWAFAKKSHLHLFTNK